MKKYISVAIVVFYLQFTTVNCFAQWQRTNGPEGAYISFLAGSSSTIFAGTFMGGIYSSSDLGGNWSCGRIGLTNAQVTSMAISGTNIFVGTEGGVFLSTDNGSTWSVRNNGLTNYSVQSIAAIGNTVFAGTWNGLFKSSDSGDNWTYLNAINYPISDIVITGTTIFAATINGGGIFRSTDSGETWIQINTGLTNLMVSELAQSGSYLYAGTQGGGLFLSSNEGLNWTRISPNYEIFAIALDGINIFISCREKGIQFSPDKGITWNTVNAGLNRGAFSLLAFDSHIFAGSGEGVYVSDNNGNNWSAVNKGLWATSVWTLAASGEFVFAGTDGGTPRANGYGIHSTMDHGLNWKIANVGLTNTLISKIVINGTKIYAASSAGGVFLSEDNGSVWSCVGLSNTPVSSLILYNNGLYAGTTNGVFFSPNEGMDWTCIGLTDKNISCITVIGTNIFAGTVDGIYLSANYGSDWSAINNGLTGTYITSLSFNGVHIFATTNSGIFSSDDNGSHWFKRDIGEWTYSLIMDGSDFYAATAKGVYHSGNFGSTWESFSAGIENFQILSLVLNDSFLYAGTLGGSVWKRPVTRGNLFAIEGLITDNLGNPLNDVLMYGLPGNPVTGNNGIYADSISRGWSGTVTPIKKGYVFSPVNRSYSKVQGNLESQNFNGVYASHPSIVVTPDSSTIYQTVDHVANKPSYKFIENLVYNPVDPIAKTKNFPSEHQMGCLVPDSVVRYWKNQKLKVETNTKAYPLTVDWSINDSPVKDQGSCGSCWAFAATAFIENIGSQNDLSEQVVVSCSGAGNCRGGNFDQALQFYKTTGVPDESCYNYTQTDGDCSEMCTTPSNKERISTVSSTLWGIATVDNLKEKLQSGPLVVRMLVPTDSTFNGWPGYQGGIYNYNGGVIPDSQGHAVLLVGYDDNQQCFKVKNSWGENWGENGYFRISYDDVTDDVNFGSYAVNGSGVYTYLTSFAPFTLSNTGNDDLIITSISVDKDWLKVSNISTPFSISPSGFHDLTVSVDWSIIGSATETGKITIESNDPEKPSVIVKLTAIPLPCVITTPTVGPITQPTCINGSGSVFLYDLPAIGSWTLTQYPEGINSTRTGSSATISSLAPGTYTFSVTNASGCTSDVSASVVINAQPMTPVSPSIGAIIQPTCAVGTGNVTLENLPETGSWTLTQYPEGVHATGTGTSKAISALAPGTYTFSVTNASGCTSDVSANVVINAQPQLPTPVIALLNGSVLHSDATAGNQWYNQEGLINGAIYQDYVPIETGEYFTIVTFSDCISDTSNQIHFSFTQIHLSGEDNFIRLYPNPVMHELNIEIENSNEKINVEILNSIGQTVYHSSLLNKTVVHTNNYLPGIYLIIFEVEGKLIFRKLIKY